MTAVFKVKTKTGPIVPIVLLACVFLVIPGLLVAQSETEPELAKYIEVLVKMRDGIGSDLRAKRAENRPIDESLADQLKRIQDMSDLLHAIEDIDEYIKIIKTKGMPDAD
tara:strand:+ start:254 stop:583 length:330 start_codon:yes stop_codon:yes gene_type:complete